jgi:hypothetical protein
MRTAWSGFHPVRCSPGSPLDSRQTWRQRESSCGQPPYPASGMMYQPSRGFEGPTAGLEGTRPPAQARVYSTQPSLGASRSHSRAALRHVAGYIRFA